MYRARWPLSGRPYAIHVIHRKLTPSPQLGRLTGFKKCFPHISRRPVQRPHLPRSEPRQKAFSRYFLDQMMPHIREPHSLPLKNGVSTRPCSENMHKVVSFLQQQRWLGRWRVSLQRHGVTTHTCKISLGTFGEYFLTQHIQRHV